MNKKVGILGAGLCGLLLARRLHESGISFRIFEARGRLGGRIHTISEDVRRVEMGATWFGLQHKHLRELLQELQIGSFHQFQDGKGVFESSSMAPVQVFDIPEEEQSSFRLKGGTYSLIQKIAGELAQEAILTESPVVRLALEDGRVLVTTKNGTTEYFDLVVSTLPPNLFLNTVNVSPALSEPMHTLAEQTHTWMGTSIKFAVSYARPFWREKGYAGVCFSNASIASEIHDHVDEDQKRYSLKGFLVPGAVRLVPSQRETMVREQLQRYFGDEGADYLAYDELLWANETFTMGGMSNDLVPHYNNGHPGFAKPELHGKLLISGSETSPVYGGYMEGAVYAAEHAAKWAIEALLQMPKKEALSRP